MRTNNDLEGWHNGLNRRAKGRAQLPHLYSHPAAEQGSHSSEPANSPCLRQVAEAISANGIQNDAEEAVYAVEAA